MPSVAVASAAIDGTATYTPTAGYSGTDSFTNTATDSGGTSSPATLTIMASAPSFVFSPAAGALTAGTVNAAYSQTIAASGGTAPYTYAVTSGSLPAGLSLNMVTGAISGTPTAGGNLSFTITATDANSATGSVAYTLAVSVPAAPVASAVNVTVAANSSSNPVTLNLSGGAATSVAIASAALHGTATASGTAITYTPTAGYFGSDSFTYTATNSGGTSSPATVTITVSAPTLAFSPAAGALTAGTVNAAYSQTIAASGGTAPYTYAVTSGSLPAGLSLNMVTGAISGTPTAAGNASFAITAIDANDVGGSAAYTLAVSVLAPVANPVNVTVAANSSANPVTLNLSGGAATSVTVASAAIHGTATASGTAITYTPTAGYFGSDSFTYTATNSGGTSSPATVTITVSEPTIAFSPASGALTAGTVNTAYSQAITASGGTAPYTYTVSSSSLPAGLSLNTVTGAISGTPTASGNANFTITATDAYGASGTAVYTLAVSPAPSVSFTFSPPSGALTDGMASEDFSQQLTATGGTAPLIYSITSGILPSGMMFNGSTGELTGTLSAESEGDYSFTLQVRDANNATGTASYTLHVKERAVTVDDKVVNVAPGSAPANVDLAAGATGGPFVSADIVTVSPSNAGTVSIVNGEFAQLSGPMSIGWYLKFTPNPAYSGLVTVSFSLTSALGVSNIGTVTYNIGYGPASVASDVDGLVRGFVRTRQNLIASTIKIPGLLERQRMAQATGPVTARMTPSAQGVTLGISTSLAQMEASRNTADGVVGGELSPFNVWIDGTVMAHNREANGNKWGNFAMVSAGADYLLTEKALMGLSFHYDRMTDPTDEDAKLTGNGWLAGPYASFEIGKGMFWDSSLLYGGSSNTIDTRFWDGSFDTTRWMLDTSLSGQWNLYEAMTLTPKLRAVYFSETAKDYEVSNGQGDVLGLQGFTEEQLRVSLGAEIARQFTLENDMTLTPKLGLTGGFSGLDGSGAFGQVSAGLSLESSDAWSVDAGLLFNFADENEKSVGAKVGLSGRF